MTTMLTTSRLGKIFFEAACRDNNIVVQAKATPRHSTASLGSVGTAQDFTARQMRVLKTDVESRLGCKLIPLIRCLLGLFEMQHGSSKGSISERMATLRMKIALEWPTEAKL